MNQALFIINQFNRAIKEKEAAVIRKPAGRHF